MKKTYQRILDITYKNGTSHLSSCLSMVKILTNIYNMRGDNDPVILSNGHSALALYCVLEKEYGLDAEDLFKRHGVHPNRSKKDRIWASTGSLGHGVGIALGMALANRDRNVYCTVSDGESYEGSFYEAINTKRRYNVKNLRVYLNYNGFSAYDRTDLSHLEGVKDQITIINTSDEIPEFLRNVDGHYKKLDKELYEKATHFYENAV